MSLAGETAGHQSAGEEINSQVWESKVLDKDLPKDYSQFRELLENYSKIPPGEVEGHILNIRAKAWAVQPYPCIGHFSFLGLPDFKHPEMIRSITRLTAPDSQDTFLELGCFLGQTTRKLASLRVPPERLMATDLEPEFLELGFEMFRDRDHMRGATFLAGDMLVPDEEAYHAGLGGALGGKATIVMGSFFFHLFSREEQLLLGQRVVRFFKPGMTTPGVLFGIQIGAVGGGERMVHGHKRFIHNERTWQELWDEIGEATGTRWTVKVRMVGPLRMEIPGMGEDARISSYVVSQVLG